MKVFERRVIVSTTIIDNQNFTYEQIETISSVFNNFGDYMIVYNADGEIIYMNSNLLITLDYSMETLKSKKIDEILFGEFKENISNVFEYLNHTNVKVFRGSLLRSNGSLIPVKLKNTQIVYNGLNVILSVSHDISLDLRMERAEKEKLRILRNNLGGVILSIANAVEVRDSYTAGHQQRVSNLARKIAHRMGLPEQMVEGIRIAASLHDIGKIAIPSDILNKCHGLLDEEFELIKHHSNIGFQILSSIEFPWPVAAIVLQHHECIDGTGYPLGLEGPMMLLEAKVVSVADVVEAMSTHRPYRPALGIKAAIDEIDKYMGKKFDPDVAKACIELYRNGEINFSEHDEGEHSKTRRFF